MKKYIHSFDSCAKQNYIAILYQISNVTTYNTAIIVTPTENLVLVGACNLLYGLGENIELGNSSFQVVMQEN